MEDNSPYQASRVAPTAERHDRRDAPPREITSPIRHLWLLLAAMGSIVVIGGAAILFMSPGARMFLTVPFAAVGCFYLLTAFGVYKRSRFAACLVLALCGLAVVSAVLQIATGRGSLVGAGFLAVFTFVSVRGTLATFRYHRHIREVRSRPPRPRLSDDPAFAPKLDTPL